MTAKIENPCFDAALDYIERGWSPIALRPSDLKAFRRKETTGEPWGTSKDPKVYKNFARNGIEFQLAIATGARSGFWVLDLDGEKGLAWWEGMKKKHPELSEADKNTVTVSSPSGGLHLYFAMPPGLEKVKSCSSEIADKVDVKGDGGLIIAPPTYRRKSEKKCAGSYEWINYPQIFEIVETPAVLVAELEKLVKPKKKVGRPTKADKQGREDDELFAAMAEKGKGHEAVRTLSASWAARGVPKSATEAAIKAKVHTPDPNCQKLIDSAYEKFAPKFDGEDPCKRYALIAGQYYDRLMSAFMTQEEVRRATKHAEMTNDKGELLLEAAKRNDWLARNLSQYDALNFDPTRPDYWTTERGAVVLNTYLPIDVKLGDPVKGKFWADTVRDVFAGERAERVLDWLAHSVQKPGVKIGWGPVLVSEHEGAGKDFTLDPVRNYFEAFGYLNEISLKSLNDDKNGGLFFEKLMVFVNEAEVGRFHNKENVADMLKRYLVGPPNTIQIRKMKTDYFAVTNVLNMAFTANRLDSLYLDPETRRYYPAVSTFMAEAAPDEKVAYWKPRWDRMNADGWRDAVAWLMERDVSHIVPGARAPESPDMRAAVEANMPPGFEWFEEYLADRQWVSLRQMKADFEVADDFRPGLKYPPSQAITRMMKALKFRKYTGAGYDDKGRASIRVDGHVQNHVIYTRPGVTVRIEEAREALNASPIARDQMQERAHLKGGK